MINILFPLAGDNIYFNGSDYLYPKPLIEIHDLPMIELAVQPYRNIKGKKRFVFVVNQAECAKFNFDNVLKLLADEMCEVQIAYLNRPTKGALCTCMLAWSKLEKDCPLVIANYDQVICDDINSYIEHFARNQADAGTISIESIHPRWSYVLVEGENQVVEAAEKRPISKNAIAGFYYYKNSNTFIDAAIKCIENEASIGGIYFISSSLNQLILANKRVVNLQIPKRNYHSFYSPEKIAEYEMRTHQ